MVQFNSHNIGLYSPGNSKAKRDISQEFIKAQQKDYYYIITL